MHKRDYLVKQFEEFAKVMAVLMGLKKDGKYDELEELIKTSVAKYTSTEINFVESLDDSIFINTLIEDKKLNDEQLKILADLLFEKANYYTQNHHTIQASNCYQKAKCIYIFLKDHATMSYSLDMHYKLEILNKMSF